MLEFDLFGSSLRFLTTCTFDGGFELLPLPKTGSDETTTDSVKFDVVNFWPRISFAVAFTDTGVTMLASNKFYKKNSRLNQNGKFSSSHIYRNIFSPDVCAAPLAIS